MSNIASSKTRKAFNLLRTLPRVSLTNLKPNPGAKIKENNRRLRLNGVSTQSSKAHKRQRWMPAGLEQNLFPFRLKFSSQTWNKDRLSQKLSYIPFSLGKLQMLIDLKRIPVDVPIDLTQLSLCGFMYPVKPLEKDGGYLVQDEGMDVFVSEINLEVQWTSEHIIAAVERAGGTITTAYYDAYSLDVACNPKAYFETGQPIPRRMLPPQNLIEYYSDAKNRGYLADPDTIAEERFTLAQKYGYHLPDLKKSPKYEMLIERKDPRQIFYGLQPGWVVNLRDKAVVKPNDPKLIEFYSS